MHHTPGTLRGDRSRLQNHSGTTQHGSRVDSDTNAVFVTSSDNNSSFEYDTRPSEICFLLNRAVYSCGVNPISCFVLRHIITFGSSWCVRVSTPPPEYGVRDCALCLGSKICCQLLRLFGSGIMLGGYRQYLQGEIPTYDLPDPSETFKTSE